MTKLKSSGLGASSTPLPFLAPNRVVVAKTERETSDSVTLTLRSLPGYPEWRPGQFNMLYLFGLGEIPISISGSLKDTNHLTHTIKAVGPVSNALTKLIPGDEVWLRGPFGSTWPEVSDHDDLLLIAGGIGLAPLRSVMLKSVEKNRAGRTILLYGTRTPSDVLFSKDLEYWKSLANVSVHITVDRVENSDTNWDGSVGVVTHLLQHLQLNSSKTTVMTCGPEVMLRHVASDLNIMGIADRQIYVSMERNMKCALGFCGRCQWGPHFVCRDGPVYCRSDIRRFWNTKEF